ncbi:hypothetical protein ABT224_20220 [Streptomyces sp. NPDC001584]|uniref:hypothetical protein n=1 Tax=Streptomyces sp. NPDC001584 TaxID=3154521 RepID=UPI0033229379
MSNDPTTYPAQHAAYLAEVHEREAAATEGTWGVYNQGTLVEVVAGLEEDDTGYRCRRVIARLDEDPIDNIPAHAGWSADEDYGQLLHDAHFTAEARTDVPRLLGIVRETHQRAEELAAHLNLVREFRIPVQNKLGGYAELTVERGPGPFDARWAITDGATHSKKVWHLGSWYWLSAIGPDLAYRHTMQEALALGEQVAAFEGRTQDDEVRKLQGNQGAATGGTR